MIVHQDQEHLPSVRGRLSLTQIDADVDDVSLSLSLDLTLTLAPTLLSFLLSKGPKAIAPRLNQFIDMNQFSHCLHSHFNKPECSASRDRDGAS